MTVLQKTRLSGLMLGCSCCVPRASLAVTRARRGLVAGPWAGRGAVGLSHVSWEQPSRLMCAGGFGTHLAWLSKNVRFFSSSKEEEIDPVLDSPTPRDGGSVYTFRAFTAASGQCVRQGFGSEKKTMRLGMAVLNILVTGGLNFT